MTRFFRFCRCEDCGKSGTHIRCSNLNDGSASSFKCVDCVPSSTEVEPQNENLPPAAPNHSSNVRHYLQSDLHRKYHSEEVVVLNKGTVDDDVLVDVDGPPARPELEGKEGSGRGPAPPARRARNIAGRDEVPLGGGSSAGPSECRTSSSPPPSEGFRQDGESRSPAQCSQSQATTPTKSPTLRQMTLDGFASPSGSKVAEIEASSVPCSSSLARIPAKRTLAVRNSPEVFIPPQTKRRRRQRLQKGQTTLISFFTSPAKRSNESSPEKTSTSVNGLSNRMSIREWFLGSSPMKNGSGHDD